MLFFDWHEGGNAVSSSRQIEDFDCLLWGALAMESRSQNSEQMQLEHLLLSLTIRLVSHSQTLLVIPLPSASRDVWKVKQGLFSAKQTHEILEA